MLRFASVRIRLVASALPAAGALIAGDGRAADGELSSETAVQFYELRSPTGEVVIGRRRLTTTLGVGGYDLLDRGNDPRAPEITFRARLRYDADYGGSVAETSVTSFGRLVPGFERGPVDLMYGYVEGRRLLRGWLGFRVGRQYVIDALGWWSFDGGLVAVTTPYFVKAEVFGGFEQRGGMPLSTSRYERDGVWRGDRTGYDRNLWSSFQPGGLAPAFGAALESAGVPWVHGRLTYRRVYNTGAVNAAPFASAATPPVTVDEARISQERIGYALDATIGGLAGAKAGFAYDLYAQRMGNVFASVDGHVSERLTVSADYDYYVPTFDGDSIWSFFLAMPMNDLALRAAFDATSRVTLAGSVRGRLFQVEPRAERTGAAAPGEPSQASHVPASAFTPLGGGEAWARYRFGEGSLGARAVADVAESGDRIGLDVYGDRVLDARYVLSARAGAWQFSDALRDDRDAVSVGYVLGAGYRMAARSQALAELQHDVNRLVGQRYRVMLWLTLAVSR